MFLNAARVSPLVGSSAVWDVRQVVTHLSKHKEQLNEVFIKCGGFGTLHGLFAHDSLVAVGRRVS